MVKICEPKLDAATTVDVQI